MITLHNLLSQRRLRLNAAAVLFFALLAFICLYPQIFHYRTHGAGYDYFFPHWCFWWIRHALTTPGLNVYDSNFVMFPYETSFAYNALTAFWFPVWAILEPLAGTLAAMVFIIWLACTLNGYALFAFLRSERVHPGLALIGGAALQLFPISRYFYYNTHINLMDWFWLPVHLLLWKQAAASAQTRHTRHLIGWAILLGLALWGLGLTDLQFPIFTAFVLVPYGLLTLWRSSRRRHLITAGVIVLVLALALLWLAGPLPYIVQFEGGLVPGPVEDRPVIRFPSGFLSMSHTWWDWASPSLGAFVPLVTLASIVFALVKPPRLRRDRWFWLAILIPPLVFAIGPTLTVAGHDIPLPFRLLYEATDGNFRMPWRLAPVFVIAAMVFAGHVWTPALPRRKTIRAAALASIFFLLAVTVRMYETGPLRPLLTTYEFYEHMGEEHGEPYDDYVVIEAPTGAGTGEVLLGDAEAIAFQYYGITHHKRMVNGFISRAPISHFWYLHTDDPMLSWLGQRRLLEADLVRQQLAERIYTWPIGYIVVHQDYVRRNGAQPLEITGYFNALDDLLCPPIVERDAVFYRTVWHPDGCPARTPPDIAEGVYQVDIGAPGDERYMGWGWHWQETVAGLTLRWAGDQTQAYIYVDLPPGDYAVTLSMQAFWEPRRVRLLVNETALDMAATVAVESLEAYTFTVPAESIGDGQHVTITLDYDNALIPVEIGQSGDQRRLAVAVDWIQFERLHD